MVMNYMSHSYLPNKQSSVHIFGILSVLYLVKFVIPQTSTLRPLPFNIFINDKCDYIQIMST